MNAHKFAFQDLYILDLKPTTKTHWESQGHDGWQEVFKRKFSIYSSLGFFLMQLIC